MEKRISLYQICHEPAFSKHLQIFTSEATISRKRNYMFQQFKNKTKLFFKEEWQTCIIWYTEGYSISCKNRKAHSFMPNTWRTSKKDNLLGVISGIPQSPQLENFFLLRRKELLTTQALHNVFDRGCYSAYIKAPTLDFRLIPHYSQFSTSNGIWCYHQGYSWMLINIFCNCSDILAMNRPVDFKETLL